MKINGLLSVLIVLLVATVGANAVSPDFEITRVEVDDREVNSGESNHVVVERGETLEIEVWVDGQASGSTVDDVRVKTWLGGYEFGDVETRTQEFKVESDGSYKRTLFLQLPNDLEADVDADRDSPEFGNSREYTLYVEAFDDLNKETKQFTLKVSEKAHDLRIVDAIFRPSRSVDAGDMVFLTVRAENMGDNKEEDIQVRVSSSELGGVLARDYIDELVPEFDEEHDSDEETSGDVDLFFRVPDNARTGDYEVNVELIYNRGHAVVEDSFLVHVAGSSVADESTIISVDSTGKSVDAGESVTYKLMFANFGSEKVVYSAEVAGVGAWATAGVEPGFVSVNPEQTGELFVTVNAKEDASGSKPFTVRVKADGDVVKEVNLSADVADNGFGDVRKVLEVGFIVLAVLLVVLGLIIAFTKLRGDDDEEPLGEEGESAGQTYY